MKVEQHIAGLEGLDKAFRELGSDLVGKNGGVIRNGLNAAGRDVKDTMVGLAPESEGGTSIGWGYNSKGKYSVVGPEKAPKGRLKRSIFKKSESQPRHLSEIVYVGPRLGKSRNDPDGAWYAAIVEFYGGKGGKGKGYMRRSIDRHKHTHIMARAWGAGIERAAKKIGNANAQAVGNRVKKSSAAWLSRVKR